MLAARLYGAKDLRIEEMSEPEPGPGEVKIRVAYAGICGTDVHEYFEIPRATHVPNPLTGATLPQTLGHEFAGTVVTCGEGVGRVAPGARVCVRPIRTCGVCPRCTSGLSHLCTALAAIGVTAPGGGLAQYVVVAGRLGASVARRCPAGAGRPGGADGGGPERGGAGPCAPWRQRAGDGCGRGRDGCVVRVQSARCR